MEFSFNNKHFEFLKNEFGLDETSISAKNDDELDDVYNLICDIEIEETCKAGNEKLSERGETAVEIVNIMADALGYVQDDDYDDEERKSQMMVYENMSKLNDKHFDLLEKLYNMDKEKIMQVPEKELAELFFPEGDSPLWDAMLDFDDNNEPLTDTLIAEQICDILRPPDIYYPEPEKTS